MGDDNQSMGTARRCFRIVIPAHKLRYGLGQISRECGTIRGRGKAYFCVNREGGEMLASLTSAPPKITDLSHDTSTERDQVAGGKPIYAASRISGSWSQGFR
jgi:hypothetical protein